MNRAYPPYLLLDPWFFESPDNYRPEDEYLQRVEALLPEGWQIAQDGIWWKVKPAPEADHAPTPQQGFKIHISATPKTAVALLEMVVPEIVAAGAPFKLLVDSQALAWATSKTYGREASGKFLVIYPTRLQEFQALLKTLHGKTRDLEGAYVLSDRRYQGSKVLYYRYGGFAANWRLKIDGTRQAVIQTPDGEWVPDERLPFYKLPSWVEEPFPHSPDASDEDDGLLNGRYEVKAPLSFSNSGGVYLAVDGKTGRNVVIKEARPLTNLWTAQDGTILDAVSLLEHEYEILKRLADIRCIVQPVEIFQEWEHSFLVEEFFDGVPLVQYRSRDDFHLFPIERNPERLAGFCTRFHKIATQLVEAVREVHAAGVLLGDISPNNILVHPDTLELSFIDLESAVQMHGDSVMQSYATFWSTPGFRKDRQTRKTKLTSADDFYALGMALLNLVLPTASLFELEPKARTRLYEKVQGCVDLPPEVEKCIAALRRGDGTLAGSVLNGWNVQASLAERREAPRPEEDWEASDAELRETIGNLARFIVQTATPERSDRLWPSDTRLFQTNGINLAFGACGVALCLQQMTGELPEYASQWLLERELSLETHPPGFFPGLAGVSYAFAQLGHPERAAEILEMSADSPLVFEEANWFEGAAGWGWVHLYMHRRFGQQYFLDQAVEAGEKILSLAQEGETGWFWPLRHRDNKIAYGIAYGASGIAYFLLCLFEATQDAHYLDAARQAMSFELSQALERPRGLGWVRWQGDHQARPYWLYGSAGVSSVLVRFWQKLQDEEFLHHAKRAAEESFSRIAVQSGQLEGLSGMGELMMDMYVATRDDLYLRRARDLADSILRFRIERPAGTAFPGSLCLRISNDYGTGGAGVGLFLHRVTKPGPRLFHDLDANCQPTAEAVPTEYEIA